MHLSGPALAEVAGQFPQQHSRQCCDHTPFRPHSRKHRAVRHQVKNVRHQANPQQCQIGLAMPHQGIRMFHNGNPENNQPYHLAQHANKNKPITSPKIPKFYAWGVHSFYNVSPPGNIKTHVDRTISCAGGTGNLGAFKRVGLAPLGAGRAPEKMGRMGHLRPMGLLGGRRTPTPFLIGPIGPMHPIGPIFRPAAHACALLEWHYLMFNVD